MTSALEIAVKVPAVSDTRCKEFKNHLACSNMEISFINIYCPEGRLLTPIVSEKDNHDPAM
jgi:hypothetical protein